MAARSPSSRWLGGAALAALLASSASPSLGADDCASRFAAAHTALLEVSAAPPAADGDLGGARSRQLDRTVELALAATDACADVEIGVTYTDDADRQRDRVAWGVLLDSPDDLLQAAAALQIRHEDDLESRRASASCDERLAAAQETDRSQRIHCEGVRPEDEGSRDTCRRAMAEALARYRHLHGDPACAGFWGQGVTAARSEELEARLRE